LYDGVVEKEAMMPVPYYYGYQAQTPVTPSYPVIPSSVGALPSFSPQQSAGTDGTVKVNGRDSAYQFCQRMGPNSTSPAMFDTTHVGIMYIGTTDGAGVPTVEAFDYSPHIDDQAKPIDMSQYVSRSELDEVVRKLREEIDQ
jgi:hypothetical protein